MSLGALRRRHVAGEDEEGRGGEGKLEAVDVSDWLLLTIVGGGLVEENSAGGEWY